MLKILIISHGNLGLELLHSAEMIVGEQEDVEALGLGPDDSLESFLLKVKDVLDQLLEEGDEALVFVDLYGGTPSNAAAAALRTHSISCIAGVNLPILLETLLMRDTLSREALMPHLIKAGKESIVDIRERIMGQS